MRRAVLTSIALLIVLLTGAPNPDRALAAPGGDASMAGSPRADRAMSDVMATMLQRRNRFAMQRMMGATGRGTGTAPQSSRGGGGMMNGGGMTEMMRDEHDSGSDTAWLIVVALLVAGGLAALIAWRPWAGRTGPARLLDERLALGEVDVEEYGRVRSMSSRPDCASPRGWLEFNYVTS